jgi:hypothetical protein
VQRRLYLLQVDRGRQTVSKLENRKNRPKQNKKKTSNKMNKNEITLKSRDKYVTINPYQPQR